MNFTQSERTSSRRSSILKAPKPRQPLSKLELSPSSTENSPTVPNTKMKRRVSFAEKKHVKEFCDSMEQGTVWDNTYEESEVSQIKSNQNSSNDENTVGVRPDIRVPPIDTENAIAVLNDNQSGTDCDLDMTDVVSMAIRTERLPTPKYNRVTIINGAPTKIVPSLQNASLTLSPTQPPAHVRLDTDSSLCREEHAMFLESVVNVANDLSECQSLSEPNLNKLDQNEINVSSERTLIFSNMAVDFTEIVGNIVNNEKPQTAVFEKTSYETSMDFTEIVEKIRNIEKSPYQSPDRSMVCGNNIVDFTEIQNISSSDKLRKVTAENRSMFPSKSVDLAGTVSDIPSIGKSVFGKSSNDHEVGRQMSLDDQPLESIVAYPKIADASESTGAEAAVKRRSLFCSEPTSEMCATFNDDDYQPKPMDTSVFLNESLEFTCAGPSVLQPRKNKVEEGPVTTVFNNNAIEYTAEVSSLPVRELLPFSREHYVADCDAAINYTSMDSRIPDGKTMVFRDDSMELTSAVQSPLQIENNRTDDKEEEKCDFRDRPEFGTKEQTMNLHDDSMDLTSAVQFPLQSIENNRTDDKKEEKCEFHDRPEFETKEQTMNFHDDSMEITCATQCLKKNRNFNATGKENCPVGTMDFVRSSVSLFHKENKIQLSRNKRTEMMKSMTFVSPHKYKINHEDSSEPDEQFYTEYLKIRDINAGAPSLPNDNGNGHKYDLQSSETGDIEKMEFTQPVIPFTKINADKISRCPSNDPENDRSSDGMEIFRSDEKTYSSLLQVEKESVQSIPGTEDIGVERIPINANDNNGSKPPDTNANVSNVTERFSATNAREFDDPTLVVQQTAVKDCGKQSVDFRDSEKFNDERFSVDIESVELPTNNWEVSRIVEPEDVANTDSHNYFSTDRGIYDKSLEELRSRAYSVNKFRPEDMAFEFTDGIIPYLDHPNKSYTMTDSRAKEPTSFVIADGTNAFEMERELDIGRKNRERGNSLDKEGAVIFQSMNNFSANDTKIVNMEKRTERVEKNVSPTYVEEKRSDAVVLITALSAEYDRGTIEVKDHRYSDNGFTTGGEFPRESSRSPSEKLPGGETDFSTDNHYLNQSIAMETVESWNKEPLAKSNNGDNDLGRHLMFQDTNDQSVQLGESSTDQLPSIASNLRETVDHSESMEINKREDKNMTIPVYSRGILEEIVESLSKRSDTIWKIIRLDEKMLKFSFFSKSIVLAIYLNENPDFSITDRIKDITVLSRLVEDKTDPGVCLAHSLIMKKIDSTSLMQSYGTHEEIPELLRHVSTEVKLGMDFLFELDRLRNHNWMEINDNRITFSARTRQINAGIILDITMEIKPFEEINYNDITVSCLLGSEKIRETDIKLLITNVKRDHRFLRFFMTDVQNYIDLMGETGVSMNT